MNVLMEALRLAQRKRFGASSEKSEDTLSEQLSFLFNEAEVFAEEQRNKEDVTVVAAHKRHKKHEYTLDKIPEDVPVEQVEHRLEGQELVCPQCGGELTEIGKEVINKLKIIPARVVVEQHIYYSYACQHCNKENITTPVVRASRENRFLPGSFATPEAVAHIMTQKFVMGIPIYRQEQELDRRGIQLSRQTMSNWILKAAEDYLKPVYDRLHRELLVREVLHADETTLQVLHEPGKAPQSDNYMWLYRTSGDTQKPIVLYEYQPGRRGKHPKEFLNGFHGYLHTDGYPAAFPVRLPKWGAANEIHGAGAAPPVQTISVHVSFPYTLLLIYRHGQAACAGEPEPPSRDLPPPTLPHFSSARQSDGACRDYQAQDAAHSRMPAFPSADGYR